MRLSRSRDRAAAAAAPEHPFLTRITELPERFPELNGSDQLAQIARMVIVPAMRRAARRDPEAVRAATVRFLARFVIGLDIAPVEIYGDRVAISAPENDAAVKHDPDSDPAGNDVAAAADRREIPERDISKILAGDS